MSTEFIVAQILYTIGQFILIGLMFANSKKKIAILTIVMDAFFVVSFYMLGGISGSIMSIVMAFFTLCELLVLEGIFKPIVKKWADKLIYIPVIICGFFFYDGFGSLLPVIGTIFNLLSISRPTPLQIKLIMLFANTSFLFYNIHLRNYAGIIIEIGILIANIIGIFTEVRGKKKATYNNINP